MERNWWSDHQSPHAAWVPETPAVARRRLTPPGHRPPFSFHEPIIFQNRCWVFRPGVEFTGKGDVDNAEAVMALEALTQSGQWDLYWQNQLELSV